MSRISGKDIHCERVAWYEIPSDGICLDCSKDVFKLEKRYQIVEKYVSLSLGYYGQQTRLSFKEWPEDKIS